jgi:hypothetical protein
MNGSFLASRRELNLLTLDHSTGWLSMTDLKVVSTQAGGRSFTLVQLGLEMKF